jgi:hypothetical protein
MNKCEIEDKISELNASKRALTSDIDAGISLLYISLQNIEEAKLAKHAAETLKMQAIAADIIKMVFSINALGKWDIWFNLSAHVDQVEVSITRRGNYNRKLYQAQFSYRFDLDVPTTWKTVETETKKALKIIDVLNDVLNNNDPEQHFKEE